MIIVLLKQKLLGKIQKKKWISASVSRAIKNLLALNIVEQIVINTTLKYKINLDWKYKDIHIERK